MLGLVMLREYLDEILSGEKNYDARSYDTKIHGTIALVDSKKSTIVGLVDLVGTHEITAEEYAKWHLTGKWKNAVFTTSENEKYYGYDFTNPRYLAKEIKIIKTGKVWTDIDDRIKEDFYFQESLC